MFDYAVCQIQGKQIIVTPDKECLVPFLGEISELECDKVLLISSKGKVNIGAPFLKEKIKFEVLAGSVNNRIRVSFYKPKANHRKVYGQKTLLSKIKPAKVS